MNILGTFASYLGLKFEKLIYSNASRIVTSSAGMTANIKQRFPKFSSKLKALRCLFYFLMKITKVASMPLVFMIRLLHWFFTKLI